MAYLFDTDAISELLRRRPLPAYVEWLAGIDRAEQFTSAVVIGELFEGAFLSGEVRHLENVERQVIPRLAVLPYGVKTARLFGELAAHLRAEGRPLADADVQIAATALQHGLTLVTDNLRHFERIPGLTIERALVDARDR